jgi:lipopolysaccharide export system permease protein
VKLVDKLVLKELIPMFGVGVAMFATLFFAGGPLLEASKYLGQGIPVAIVVQLIGLSIPPVLALTLPMGVLLSVLLGYGRLSADSEAVALFAGGIPFHRIAAAAAVLGIVSSLIGYYLNDQVASRANFQLANLRMNALKQQGETTKPFNFEERENGTLVATVHVEQGFDITARTLRQVTITSFSSVGLPSAVFYAKTAEWKGGKQWSLWDVDVYNLGQTPSRDHFDRLSTFLLKRTPDNISFLQRSPDTLTFAQLNKQIGDLKKNGMGETDDVRNAEVGMWSKIALPFSCIVFAMIGAPLGLNRQRTSKYSGWILSIMIIFAYYVLYMAMSSVARSGGMSPWLAAFLPNIVGVCVGLVLMRRATS